MLSFILPSSLSRRGEKREAKKTNRKRKKMNQITQGVNETHWNDIRDRRKETKQCVA